MATDEHQTPGEPPAIRDEAADSPIWLPAMGLALLLLGAVFIVWQGATADGEIAEEGLVEEGEAPDDAEDEAPSGEATPD